MKTESLIYKIINKVNGKFYLGSTNNFNRRVRDHSNLLNKNKHHSILLQRAWNKYGENNFDFKIIEIVNGDLKKKEQEYLDNNIDSGDRCYNISKYSVGGCNPEKPVFQIKDYEIVGYYTSATNCSKMSENVFSQAHINRVMNDKQEMAYGYRWEHADLFPNVKEREEYLKGFHGHFVKGTERSGKLKAVLVTDINTQKEYFFKSIKDAHHELGADLRPISRGIRESVKGYKAKFI